MSERAQDLETLLALAERELTFLTEKLEDHPEVAASCDGALLLSCLEGGTRMAGRLRHLHGVSQQGGPS